MAGEYNKGHEYETKAEEGGPVETQDRGMFDFLGKKKEEEKPVHHEQMVSEFEKVKLINESMVTYRQLRNDQVSSASNTEENGEYLIGVGSYDMTGPAAGVVMMGYANLGQTTAGVHFRLRARTFIVAERSHGPRFAFVNLDAGMASQLVNIKVLEKLKSRFGDLYTEENVAISGIHTHAGPGGYLQYYLYAISTLGFIQESFDVIVNAIVQSIIQAHHNLKPGSIFINQGDVINAG
ncbi:hypothetical protein ACLB2K_009547 [Fragaria x ananassa]